MKDQNKLCIAFPESIPSGSYKVCKVVDWDSAKMQIHTKETSLAIDDEVLRRDYYQKDDAIIAGTGMIIVFALIAFFAGKAAGEDGYKRAGLVKPRR